MSAEPHPLRRAVLTAILVVTALVVAVLAGATATLGLARVTDRAAAVLAAGGVVEGLVAATALSLILRRLPRHKVTAAAIAGGLLVGSAAAVLVPLNDPRQAAAEVPGAARWELPSGSSVRYVHVPARGQPRPTPVIFLHGGPGIADMAGDSAFFGQLSADGFDVYVYDQLGAGASTRLADPTGYSVDRDVLDLEYVRQRIGADRVILIGHSYGGALAAHYLAAHPDRVAKAVFSSPAALDPADTSSNRATAGLSTAAKLRVYAAVLQPRALLAYALLQVNPKTAHDFLSDVEADARNDTVLTLADPALHCPPGRHQPPVHGSGFYRLQYPQSSTAPSSTDIRPRIAGMSTPALVLKGSCDYLSWRSALDYTTALPEADLIYLPGAGHNLYQDRPTEALAAIRAFLTDAPLPIEPYRGTTVPPDYQGVP